MDRSEAARAVVPTEGLHLAAVRGRSSSGRHLPLRHEGTGWRGVRRQRTVPRGRAQRAPCLHVRGRGVRAATAPRHRPLRGPGEEDEAHHAADRGDGRRLRGSAEAGRHRRGEPELRQARRASRSDSCGPHHNERGGSDAHAHACVRRAARSRVEGLHRSEAHREVDVRERLGGTIRRDRRPSGWESPYRHASGRPQRGRLHVLWHVPRGRQARTDRPGD